MRIGVVGINYKSSELYLRELLAKACLRCLGGESDEAKKLNAVLLSTCNRTEIYFSCEELAEAHSTILSLLRTEIELPFEHKLYSYFGVDCFSHLALVTSGLDSVILGEAEIQRQVKITYENTCFYHPLPSCMHFLFQKSLKIGKEIRSSFSLHRGQITLEGMMFSISQKIIENFKEKEILFIGNSEINRKILVFFKFKGIKNIHLCTRSITSGLDLVQNHNIKLVDWSKISTWQKYSLVICATNQQDHLINSEHLSSEEVNRARLIFDLSVPRNVDPLIGKHPQITLLNIEELGHLMNTNQGNHQRDVERAKLTVRRHVEKQLFLFLKKEKIMEPLCI